MLIDPKRLKQLRKGKLTRGQLATKSKISERTIARLESETAPASSPQERTINELAKALGVEPGVLAGEMPLPDATERMRPEAGQRRQISAQLHPNASLAYALIKRRYGLGLTTLVNAAPLMFVLLAEGSFVWRREKAEEAQEAAHLLRGLGLGNRKFWIAADRADDAAGEEENSLSQRDVFGKELFEESIFDEGYDSSSHNPFADYLRGLATKINDTDVVEIHDHIHNHGPLQNFPGFAVCSGDVEAFTGGSELLSFALRMGSLRIDQMPEDLWADDALEKREKWLKERIPEEEKESLERLLSLLPGPTESDGEDTGR